MTSQDNLFEDLLKIAGGDFSIAANRLKAFNEFATAVQKSLSSDSAGSGTASDRDRHGDQTPSPNPTRHESGEG